MLDSKSRYKKQDLAQSSNFLPSAQFMAKPLGNPNNEVSQINKLGLHFNMWTEKKNAN